jgi:YYY domain-containing protein
LLLFLIVIVLARKYLPANRPSLKTIILYEVFFFVMLAFWAFIKGTEPSIHSLEKYMDFGFIQSILNSKYLPPQDMWFAATQNTSFPINYYYFGHFIVAFMTRLTNLPPTVTYNLMIATIFALSTTICFSIGFNLFLFLDNSKSPRRIWYAIIVGIIAAYITNLGGNLHTIYLFTKGYPNDNPVPFWNIISWFNPGAYWYPNATRFIPYTIHEFPSYSYVVSDLHGHVLDIPFVLFLLSLFIVFLVNTEKKTHLITNGLIILALGIAYMTNSTDYLVYGALFFFVTVIKYRSIKHVLLNYISVLLLALVVTLPFSISFKPFASALGVNCAPSFLVQKERIGPFVFEKDKCQTSPIWMLGVLWGFFWIQFAAFLRFTFFKVKDSLSTSHKITYFIFFGFVYSILLTMFSEFFYFKDIYPAHFRANTMFKLGYQAFIIMSVLSAVVIVNSLFVDGIVKLKKRIVYLLIMVPTLFLISIYPFFSVPSYFGELKFKTLDGSHWIKESFPEVSEMITVLNNLKDPDHPFAIVEAHGDSYTDYDIFSAQTGIPTIVGWPVHEWLWRGSYDIVGPRAQEVQQIYESDEKDISTVSSILKKYNVKYIVVSKFERDKYPSLNYKKFYKIGSPIYQTNNNFIFRVHGY